MKNRRRIFRNIVLPLAILVPLIGFMVGCIYIPTWDHTILSGTKKDFRGWAADHDGMTPHKLAMFTRSDIQTIFGQPTFVSRNGRCIAYVMGTEHDIWIWPLCFGGGFVNGETHVLKLVFDPAGRLHRVVPLKGYRSPQNYAWLMQMEEGQWADPNFRAIEVLRESNQHCPADEMIEVPDTTPATQPAAGPPPVETGGSR